MQYRSIIFDLGAVILDIDFQKTIDAFIKLGISNFDEIFSAAVQTEIFDLLDKGQISPEAFRKELILLTKSKITTTQFDEAWNAMILDFPADRIRYIKSLKDKYAIYLLSNTNIIHYPVYTNLLKTQFSIENLDVLFEKVYLSFQLGLRKPQKEIFQLVLNENNLIPAETLFVDDNIDNVEAARELGFGTLHLTNGMAIENDLDRFLLA